MTDLPQFRPFGLGKDSPDMLFDPHHPRARANTSPNPAPLRRSGQHVRTVTSADQGSLYDTETLMRALDYVASVIHTKLAMV